MGKKKTKKAVLAASQPQPETITTVSFGYEEMLSELEAIVAEAEIRLQEEESVAWRQYRPRPGPIDLLTQRLS